MHKTYMHLTNYALNKNSENYKTSEDLLVENEASKRTLTSLYVSLEKEGVHAADIEAQIREIVAKTVLAMEPYLTHNCHRAAGKEKVDFSRCFQVPGMEVTELDLGL